MESRGYEIVKEAANPDLIALNIKVRLRLELTEEMSG